MGFQAVLWDFGGVITTSPFDNFNRYEAERGLPRNFIRGVNAINHEDNAWAKFESSRCTVEQFDVLFAAETAAAGHEIRGREVIGLLGGDVALLWPAQGFLAGLASFLLAHLAYLTAFTRVQRLAARIGPFVVYAVVAGGVLTVLWPGVPSPLRGPVLAYVLCLSAMAAQAGVLWRAAPTDPAARRMALGGALFVVSDALLAMNRFAVPLPLASLFILVPYWAAQACIASGLARAPR